MASKSWPSNKDDVGLEMEDDNELAAERLEELRTALRVEEGRSTSAEALPRPVSGSVYAPYATLQDASPTEEVTFLEQLLTQVQERRKPVL